MGKTSRDAGRFKYGVCLNDECPMCKSKKVQQIPMRKELVCAECGKPLRESVPPKSSSSMRWVAIAAVAVIVITAVVLGGTGVFSGSTKGVPNEGDSLGGDSVDTIVVVEPKDSGEVDSVKKTPENDEEVSTKTKDEDPDTSGPTPPPPPSGTLSLSYGTYEGAIKDGYPNGQGRLKYNTTRQISKYDSKGHIAHSGDYVQGEFVNGFITIGKHFNAQGELLGTINAGAPDGVYESK